jgi:ribA/ribD-fused uncharacterized protein
MEKYLKKTCISFAKVDGPFGTLHNMAPGCPIRIGELCIRTSEHLYQAMRFTHRPDIQQIILETPSPMAAKMKMKEYIDASREDWEQVKVSIMGWCLSLKLSQNWEVFGGVLASTRDRILVEYSKNDHFWGAKPEGEYLIGENILGKMLMKLRERMPDRVDKCAVIEPPRVKDLMVLGVPVETFTSNTLLPIVQKTKVVNRHHNAPFDVYIGRGSIWGNPFSHQEGTTAKFKVTTREEAVQAYSEWIRQPEQAYLLAQIKELKGRILGCSCSPLCCHGDVLVELAEETF